MCVANGCNAWDTAAGVVLMVSDVRVGGQGETLVSPSPCPSYCLANRDGPSLSPNQPLPLVLVLPLALCSIQF